jgi:hypothetical protein
MFLNDWKPIQNYIDGITEELKNNTPVNTGALQQSMEAFITTGNTQFELSWSGLEYASYIDQGVNGTGPLTPGAKHSIVTGSPFSFSKKKIPAGVFSSYAPTLSGQFAIANSVRQNGIEPRNFIQPVLDKRQEGLADLVAETIWDNFYKTDKKKNKKTTTIRIW